jgi:hypothetical protein
MKPFSIFSASDLFILTDLKVELRILDLASLEMSFMN